MEHGAQDALHPTPKGDANLTINPKPCRTLILQTYDGTSFEAYIEADVDPRRLVQQEIEAKKYLSARETAPATARYNCHGLVLAGRRATVGAALPSSPLLTLSGVPKFDRSFPSVDVLLRRDGYSPIPDPTLPKIGDVIAYRKASSIEHTGFVINIENIPGMRNPIIWVWSKWGRFKEFVHQHQDCPDFQDSIIEYWRIM